MNERINTVPPKEIKYFERCLLLMSLILAMDTAFHKLQRNEIFNGIKNPHPTTNVIDFVIAMVEWLFFSSFPFLAALMVSRKKSRLARWIFVALVAIFDLFVLAGLRYWTLTEFIAFCEMLTATIGLFFLYTSPSRKWLQEN